MKKIITSLKHTLLYLTEINKISIVIAIILFSNYLQAQVSTYSMSDAETAYSSQSGLTNLATGTGSGGTMDDQVFTAIPIGFTFIFNCQSYTTVGVSTNGFIWFGTTNPTATEYNPISSNTAMDGVVAAYALDIIGGGSASGGSQGAPRLSYGNPGTGVFMVEWNGCKKKGVGIANNNNRFDLQIELLQTSNTIIIRVNDYQYGYSQFYTGQVGLRGSSNLDINNLGVDCISDDWTAPSTVDGNTATCSMNPCYPGNFGTCQEFTYTPTISCCTPPTVNANTTATTVCEGAFVTLTASGTAASYSWDNGVIDGTAFAPSNTATYTVIGDNGSGCTASASVTVNVNTAPPVTANASSTSICFRDTVVLTGGGALTYAWNNGVTDGQSFSPLITKRYTVTGMGGNGCTDTASIIVSVNQLPQVTAHVTDTLICAGTMVTFTGSGALNYIWDNGVTNGVPFAPTDTTTFTVFGTDSNNCTNTSLITVDVNPLPVVSINLSAIDTLCYLTGVVNLTGESPSGGVYSGVGVSGNTFNPFSNLGTNTITYTYTDVNTCSNTASGTIYVDVCTGIANATNSVFQLNVYPNPTTGLFYITIDKPTRVTIYNVLDQLIFDKELSPTNNKIDITNFGNGLYLLKATQGNSGAALRIFKN